MMPGVTNFPVPSTTWSVASGGAATSRPTATILPSRSRTDAFGSSWPAPVRTVAFRISTGGLGRRL